MNIERIPWEVVEIKPGLQGGTELKSAEKEENISSRAGFPNILMDETILSNINNNNFELHSEKVIFFKLLSILQGQSFVAVNMALKFF